MQVSNQGPPPSKVPLAERQRRLDVLRRLGWDTLRARNRVRDPRPGRPATAPCHVCGTELEIGGRLEGQEVWMLEEADRLNDPEKEHEAFESFTSDAPWLCGWCLEDAAGPSGHVRRRASDPPEPGLAA